MIRLPRTDNAEMTAKSLQERLAAHAAWLRGNDAGRRAELAGVDLSGASLAGANLSGANLASANLAGVDLRGAFLVNANLAGANLVNANFRDTNLAGANLVNANLYDACLRNANLVSANLRSANLSGAKLAGADLCGAYLSGALNLDPVVVARLCILPAGELIVWKCCADGVLAKLRIPADAPRSNATGRRCRAEFADVLEIVGAAEGRSTSNAPEALRLVYRAGERVTCHSWCDDRWQECGGGIHFYLTREEAEVAT